MGLLDSMLGAAAQQLGQKDGLGAVLGQLLGNDGAVGGIGGLVERFQAAGMGDTIASWIGRGENLPISADQLREVLGSGTLGQVAQGSGLDAGHLGELLAQALPGLVDRLTPDGQAPAGGLGDMGELLGKLGPLLGGRA